jgi:hypothetical protein
MIPDEDDGDWLPEMFTNFILLSILSYWLYNIERRNRRVKHIMH